jgi:hypothetical protein
MASTIPDAAQQPQSNGETLAKKEEGSPYTLEGLQAHNTRESFWMLLHDKVYDVSKFLDEVSQVAVVGAACGERRAVMMGRCCAQHAARST